MIPPMSAEVVELPQAARVSSPRELAGSWQLDRRLVDRRAGQLGHVTGRLELTLVGPNVRWFESGELAWDGELFQVSRELRIVPDGEGWAVRFTDGRLFHPWRPGQFVEHPCADDLYRGLISVNPTRARLRVLWDVTGPGKDQRIFTRCVRSLSPEVPARRGRPRPV